jgi:hypothetical protein
MRSRLDHQRGSTFGRHAESRRGEQLQDRILRLTALIRRANVARTLRYAMRIGARFSFAFAPIAPFQPERDVENHAPLAH